MLTLMGLDTRFIHQSGRKGLGLPGLIFQEQNAREKCVPIHRPVLANIDWLQK